MKGRIRFDYRWVMIAICFLMVMIALGFANSTKSLFPDEIAKDLGVARSLVSIGESCRYIATAITNLFFSLLVIKFGPKKLISFGFLALILATFLYSIADSLPLIYVAGTLLGIGFSWTTTTMVGYVVGIWCSENKGTVMGFILASSGLGGAIAIKVVGNLIDPNVVGSYRAAYRLITAVLIVTLALILIFFRSKLKHDGQSQTANGKSTKKRGQDWVGIEFSKAIRKFYFWEILICVFFSGLILQGTSGIAAMHLKDVGIDYGQVKSLLSFGALILAGAKFFTGFVYDRAGLRVTSGICTIFAIAATFLLASVKGTDTGFVLAVIYVIAVQLALPLETVMLPIYALDLFGSRSYAKVLGLFVSVNVSGYAVGAPLMNLCYDLFASYKPILILVGCVMCGVLLLLQFVITSAHKEQQKIEFALQQAKIREENI